jgi:uncharacterized membrane protein
METTAFGRRAAAGLRAALMAFMMIAAGFFTSVVVTVYGGFACWLT